MKPAGGWTQVCAVFLLELADIVDFLDHRPADLKRDDAKTSRSFCRLDYVTEMEKIKHPFDRKIQAGRGEY